MSDKIGGPAFPGENDERFGQPNDFNPGMTMRQWYKGMVLGMGLADFATGYEDRARIAGLQADAMIAEDAEFLKRTVDKGEK